MTRKNLSFLAMLSATGFPGRMRRRDVRGSGS